MTFELTTLGEYARVQGGYAYKSKDFSESGTCPVLKIKNVRFGNVDYAEASFISEEIANETTDWKTKEGDILISMTGSGPNAPQSLVGRVARVWENEPEAWINQRVGRIVLKEDGSIHPDFLFYLLSTPRSQDYLVSNSSGSANQANISGKTIESLPCPKVDYDQSAAIAKILRELDQKILLNRQINQTLEQIAQAIFKSWFVDFGPVKAKIEAKENGQATERAAMRAISGKTDKELNQLSLEQRQQLTATAALFPDELEESPHGEIPKGWEWKQLYEIAEYVNGAAFKSADFSSDDQGLPIVKIAELKQGISSGTKFTQGEFRDKYAINTGDMLYSWSGSPETSLEVFKWFGGPGWLNQHIFKVNVNSKAQKYFVFFLLRHMKPILIRTAQQKQTTGLGHVTVADMKRIRVAYPDDAVLDVFSNVVGPLYEEDSVLEQQIMSLAQTRDALLPKFLNGEINLVDERSVI